MSGRRWSVPRSATVGVLASLHETAAGAEGVATVGVVEPEGGDAAITLDGEDLGGMGHVGMVGLEGWTWPRAPSFWTSTAPSRSRTLACTSWSSSAPTDGGPSTTCTPL